MSTDKAKELALDVDFETARAIHRVVRAMHDGECVACHRLFKSTSMVVSDSPLAAAGGDETCPMCGFTITAEDQAAAMDLFAPIMEKNLSLFEDWRSKRSA